MNNASLAQWLQRLESLHPRAMELGLERVSTVADTLQLRPFPAEVITVAGTNGKGSTCAALEAHFFEATRGSFEQAPGLNALRMRQITDQRRHELGFDERFQLLRHVGAVELGCAERRDHVADDVGRGALHGDRPAQPVHAHFRRGVVGLAEVAV